MVLLLVFVGLSWALSWGEEILGRPFTILFFIGAVFAVLLVRRKNVFTAVVQPPLVALVTIPLFQYLNTGGLGSDIGRTEVITILVPLAKRFPLLLATCLVVLAIALVRTLILEPRTHRKRGGARGGRRSASARHGAARPSGSGRRAAPKKVSPGKGGDEGTRSKGSGSSSDDGGDAEPSERRISAAEAARKSSSERPPIRRVSRATEDETPAGWPEREPDAHEGRHAAED